jgi:quercetin dioxygenase-like cupin family protein
MDASTESSRSARVIIPPVLGSICCDTTQIDWQPTEEKGFWIKPLYENVQQGEKTLLMKVDPGARAPLHAHEQFEQFYVLEGSLYDENFALRAGDYCCRAANTLHTAGSHDGALVLLIYTKAGPTTTKRSASA